MSKASRRRERNLKRRRKNPGFQATMNHTSTSIKEKVCVFCGCTDSLQRHHICQLRFNGPDTEDNKVWICAKHHRILHWLMDQNLSWVLRKKNIEQHFPREKTELIFTDEHTEEQKPSPEEELNNQVTITNSTVTINYR